MHSLFGLLWDAVRSNSIPNRESVWSVLFPEQDFRDEKMRHFLSELYALANDFLSWETIRNDKEKKRFLLGNNLLERGLEKLFEFEYRKMEKVLARKPVLNEEDHLLHFQWAQNATSIGVGVGRGRSGEITSHYSGLDEWFMFHKLRQACSFLSRSRLFEEGLQGSEEIVLLGSILENLESHDFSSHPGLELYYTACQMLTTGKVEAYQSLRSLLDRHSSEIAEDDVRSLHMMVINFCIKQLNDGKEGFLKEIHGLYQAGLNQGWIFEQGKLSPWTFKNIVSVGLKLLAFEEVETFVLSYKSSLPQSHRYDYAHQAIAELYFSRGEFKRVLKTIRFVQIQDPITHSRLRIIRLKACYELGEWGLLETRMENFERYLRRSKHSTYHLGRYLQFNRMVRRLMGLLPGSSPEKIRLNTEIEEMADLLEKNWLLEKCHV